MRSNSCFREKWSHFLRSSCREVLQHDTRSCSQSHRTNFDLVQINNTLHVKKTTVERRVPAVTNIDKRITEYVNVPRIFRFSNWLLYAWCALMVFRCFDQLISGILLRALDSNMTDYISLDKFKERRQICIRIQESSETVAQWSGLIKRRTKIKF